MILAIAFGGAGGIEVAQGDKLEAVDLVVPAEDFLKNQLGFAVGIDGLLGQGFIDGEPAPAGRKWRRSN